METRLVHLPSPMYCGRAVKLRMLSASEVDRANELAFDRAQASGNLIKQRAATLREATKMMIVAVTTASVASVDDAMAPTTEWTKLTVEQLDQPGPNRYESLFGAKDDGFFAEFFSRFHEVKRDEVSEILGKAIALTS